MNLKDSELSVDVLRLLISAVSDELSIDGCRLLCAESGEHIQRLLQPMPAPTLRHIKMNLKDSELSVDVLRLLISAVSDELFIDGCRLLCAESGEHIQRLLQPMPAPTLRHIKMNLNDSELSVDVLRLLISAVSDKLSIDGYRLLCAESGEHMQTLLQSMPAPTLREIEMNLNDNELPVDVLRLLISAVSERLSINGCRLQRAESGEHMQRLLQSMPAPTLRQVDMYLNDSELSVDVLRLLISTVSEKLVIRYCRLLCAESGEQMQRLLQPMPAPTLRQIEMNLNHNELSVDVVRLLISAVSERLSINGCRLLCAESGEHIQRLLQSMPAPTLRELEMNLNDNELSVDVLRLLISAVSERLSINGCRLLRAESGEHIQRLLRSMPAPTLRQIEMNLNDNELSVDVLRLLISAVSEKLEIRYCGLLCAESGEHMQRLLQSMPAPTLRQIKMNLNNNELSVDVLRLLTSAVSDKLSIGGCRLLCAENGEHMQRLLQSMPAPTLRQIGMYLNDSELSVDVLRLLISAVSDKLSIDHCRLQCTESGEHIQRLLQSMPAPTLRQIEMNLNDNELSVDVLRLLISAVSNKLSIDGCRLLCAESGEHIQRLLQSMPAPTLRQIGMYLNDSELSVDVLRLLISAVSDELSIGGCRLLCAESREHIQRLLQPMPAPTLRQIEMNLKDSELSVDVLRLLISAVSDELSIDGCRLLCAENGEHIQRLLQPMPAPTLRHIKMNLKDSELSVDVLRLLISAVSDELFIDGCRLLCAESGEHIQRLLQPMPAPTLRHIKMNLNDSELSVDVLRLLISAVSDELFIDGCRLLCAESGEHIQRLLQSMPAPTLRQIEMNLNDNELSVDVLRLLISAVSDKLSIDGCRLLCAESGEHMQRLLQSMPAPTLREIEMNLNHNELSVDVLRLLISAVSDKLSIDGYRLLCAESGEHMQRLLQSMPAPTLRQIDMYLNDSELSVDVLRLLISTVSEKLEIRYCRLLCAESGEQMQRLLQSMPAPTLREIEINLNHNELSVDVVRLLISAVSERLSINGCRLLCAESGEHMQRLLQSMPAPTLRQIEMNLNDNELSVDVLRLLISAVSDKLSIDGYRLLCAESGEHMQTLLQSMPAPTLREIEMNLNDNELPVDALRLLISAVSERLSINGCRLQRAESGEHMQRLLQSMPAPTLRQVDMYLNDSELSVDVLRLLISTVSEKLVIRYCRLLCAESGEQMQRLLQPMPAPTLRQIEMNLNHNELSVDVVRLLISAVSERLSINGCRLLCAESGEHMQRLLQSMPAPTLRELEMNLNDNELSVDVLRLLISAVSERLSINGCRLLRAESGEHIQRLLRSMPAPTLRQIEMNLNDNELPVDVLRLLISAVSEKLEIRYCGLLCAESGEHMQRLLQSMPAPTLRQIKMNLNDNELSVDVLRLLTSAVSDKLSIGGCRLLCAENGEHMQRLLQSMPAPTLRQIKMNLNDNELSVDVLRLLISAVSERLSINGCRLLRAESGKHMQRLLQSMPAPTLRKIDMYLNDNELSVDVLRLLISAVSERLSINGCRLQRAESGEHMQRLLQSMPAPTLRKIEMYLKDNELSLYVLRLLISAVSEKLEIRYCRLLCAESGEHIRRLLQSMPAPTLRQIHMYVNDSELSVDVLRLLISAVSEKLKIRYCRLLCAESGEHIQRLLQSMPAPTLRQIEMNLNNNELSVDVLRLLISAVSEKLEIRYCRLLCAESGEHMQRLLQSMPAPTLRELEMNLNDNELSVDVLRLLISAVSERLSINGCRLLRAESGEHIQRLLRSMPAPTLRQIEMNLNDNELPVDVLRLLISAVSEKLEIRYCGLLCAESGEHMQRLLQSMPAPTLRQIKMNLNDNELSVDVLRLLTSAVSDKLSIGGCRLLCAENGEHMQRLLQSMPAPTLRQIKMNLNDNELSVDVLRLLISAVSERLSINGCRLLRAESGKHMQRLLQSMPAPTLRKIDMYLNDNELSVDVLRLLISAVSERLSINGCRLQRAESGEHMQRLLQSMPAPTLRKIDMYLKDNELSLYVLRLLISAVSEKLEIRYCRLLCAESGEHIRRLLQSMPAPTLRQIHMYVNDSELSVDVLRLLISAVSEKLKIRYCRLLCAESGEHIQRLLQSMPAPTLRQIEMNLNNNELSVDVLRLLISAVSEKLEIRYCRLLCAESGEHMQRLLQSMPAPTLRQIKMNLNDNELSVDVLRLLISAVSEKLSINGCRLLRAESGEHMQRLLQSMPAPTLRQIYYESKQQ